MSDYVARNIASMLDAQSAKRPHLSEETRGLMEYAFLMGYLVSIGSNYKLRAMTDSEYSQWMNSTNHETDALYEGLRSRGIIEPRAY